MRLYELAADQIDQELENIAKKTGSQTTPDANVDSLKDIDGDGDDDTDQTMGGDMGGMDGGMGGDLGMMGGGMGGDPMGGPMNDPVKNPDQTANQEEWNDTLKKNIDSYLITTMQSHEYVKNWNHKPGSKTHPMAILAMDNSELATTKTITRNLISNKTMKDQLNVYDDPEMKYLQQLYSYVEKTIQAKNKAAEESRPKEEKKAHPKPGKAWNPKTKPGAYKTRS